jgi:hypothetical protein
VSDEETCVQSLERLMQFPLRLPAGTRATIGGGGIRGRETVLAAAGFRLGAEAFDLDGRPALAATR